MSPRILPRPEHIISRKGIDADALKVLYRLKNHGYVAYMVGGGVRDLLLARRPKDFDIGTSAPPAQVKRLFRNCFVIGRRFRLCHVRFGNKVVEVSTFRKQSPAEEGETLEPLSRLPRRHLAERDGVEQRFERGAIHGLILTSRCGRGQPPSASSAAPTSPDILAFVRRS